jgi:hypothetical protein
MSSPTFTNIQYSSSAEFLFDMPPLPDPKDTRLGELEQGQKKLQQIAEFHRQQLKTHQEAMQEIKGAIEELCEYLTSAYD